MSMANTVRRAPTVAPEDSDALIDAGSTEPELAQLDAIAVGQGPIGDIAVDPTGKTLVVTNCGKNSVSVIDAETMAVGSVVEVGGEPFAVTADNRRAYVAASSASHDFIAVVDTDAKTVVATHGLMFNIIDVAVAADGKRLFVGGSGRSGAELAAIDLTTGQISLVETGPGVIVDAISVSPNGRRVYATVSDAYGGDLVMVDADSLRVSRSVAIGSPIRDVSVSPDGRTVYVLASDPRRGGAMQVVDAAFTRVVASVEIGGAPTQMTLSPDGAYAYVVDQDHVAVVCTVTNETLGTVTFGAQPSCLTASPEGTRLYVPDYTGLVTTLAVAPAATMPLFQIAATDVMATPEVRELEPAV